MTNTTSSTHMATINGRTWLPGTLNATGVFMWRGAPLDVTEVLTCVEYDTRFSD